MWTPNAAVIVTKEKQDEQSAQDALSSARVITARQFWLGAVEVGVTKASLLEDIAKSYDAAEGEFLRIEVESATSFHRDNKLVSELSGLLGIEPYQLDALWLRAASL